MKVKKKRKVKIWVIPTAMIIIALLIPSVFAFYLYVKESSMKTEFAIKFDDSVFVRAYVLTYWENKEDGNMVGKTSWPIKEDVFNSNWTKIDGYYYYNGFIKNSDIVDGMPANDKLIDASLTISELSDEDLTNSKYVANYKIVYELVEVKAEGTKLSCEDAWGIEYTEDGIPSKIT